MKADKGGADQNTQVNKNAEGKSGYGYFGG